MRFLLPLGLFVAVVGCGESSAPERAGNPLGAPPVDSSRVTSVAEAAGWAYKREIQADLDGDGVDERVVIAADLELSAGGRPLWEDGHRWAVYVEPQRYESTLLYAAFVPNGFAEAAILRPDAEGRRRVLVQERTPHQIRTIEVEYQASGAASSSSSAYYQIDQWLPGTAALP